jgi:cysteine desulfurase/selenocysteine lyase
MEQELLTQAQARNTHGLDIEKIRSDFSMLSQKLNGKPLIYFDSAATSPKPNVVLERLHQYYSTEYGKPKEVHELSKGSTEAMEDVRAKIAKMIGAEKPKEVIFTKGCTEAINIVANGFSRSLLNAGDEIIISQLEHHANIVPWHMACRLSGAVLKVAPLTPDDDLDLNQLESMITDRTKIISVSHSSHVLGTIFPIKQIAEIAHKRGIALLADGAQAAPHMPVNMQELDCDFYSIAGHKMGTPTGLGFLYGKEEWLNKIAPLQGGGEMAKEVTFESSAYAEIPTKFEGGTTAFAQIIATGTLVDYLHELDMGKTAQYEEELLYYAVDKLSKVDRVNIFGKAPEKEPLVSFNIEGLDVKKLESYLNAEWGIAVRAGELTAQPLMKLLGAKSLIRASFGYYNTFDEIDTFIDAVETFIKEQG